MIVEVITSHTEAAVAVRLEQVGFPVVAFKIFEVKKSREDSKVRGNIFEVAACSSK
jgi:hypothetical protein